VENKNLTCNLAEISPLSLAFVGDAVFSLHVRKILVQKYNISANALTKKASAVVNAGNQYLLFRKIEPLLSEIEAEIAKRARNANIHSHAKNYSVTEYIYATAFEAVLGYLELSGQETRKNELLNICLGDL
jgi:ribonuclease-3 family protein